MSKRAVIYARVSYDDQARSGAATWKARLRTGGPTARRRAIGL